MLSGGHAAADEPNVLGWLEWSWLLPAEVRLKAKLDTGARTSSIHAVDIEPFEHNNNKWVRFRIPLSQRSDDTDHKDDLVLERPVEREVHIKDHVDQARSRFVVSLSFCVGGITFETPVSLADRSRFNYPLLFGRLAISGRAVVDPAQTFTANKRCGAENDEAAL